MQETSSRPVRTYTIGLAGADFDEARHASSVARHLGTDHTELLLTGEDAQALIPRLPDVFDEPLADPSQLPTLLVSQLARQHVTVALSGDGGDEVFGGYNRYVYGTRVLARVGRVPHIVRQPMAAAMRTVPAAAWDQLSRIGVGLLPAVAAQRMGERVDKLSCVMSAASVGDMYRSLLSAWQDPQQLVMNARSVEDENDRILDERPPAGLLDRMMLADQTTYLPDDLLAKLDRASMAVSLEVRAPLLDHRVVEFAWRLPAPMKLRGSVGKWILRQVLYRRVPKDLVERPKMGFSVPIGAWLRGPLRPWAESLLDDNELRSGGLLDPAPVRRAWRELQDGRRPAGTALWAVIMFQAWRARWEISA
jgi:asparagine synthase (glutamine-hydrolysing)